MNSLNLLRLLVVLAFTSLFVTCEPPVVFMEPQPIGEKHLTTLPDQFRGMYWCKTDSITLIINDKTIYKDLDFETSLLKSEVDSNPEVSYDNGRLYIKELNQSFPAQLENDSLVFNLTLKDTIFDISEKQVAKLFKDRIILNIQLQDKSWEVKVLTLNQNNMLTIAQAEIPQDLEELKHITHVDEVNYSENEKIRQIKIAPSKDEFNQILKQGLLFDGSCMELIKISSDSNQLY